MKEIEKFAIEYITTIQSKIKNNYFLKLFLWHIQDLLYDNSELYFRTEKDFQEWLKMKIEKWLITLEEYDTVIKEEQLIGQKRIDLSFNIADNYIWIELKNWITSGSMRTLEYQINEYIERWIMYNYIFIIIKLKQKDKKNIQKKIWKYIPLFKRLFEKEKTILIIA